MSINYSSSVDRDLAALGGCSDATADWLRLIRAEYREIPGLCLTKSQVRRLWSLDVITSDAVLGELETAGFLHRTRTGAYVKTGA